MPDPKDSDLEDLASQKPTEDLKPTPKFSINDLKKNLMNSLDDSNKKAALENEQRYLKPLVKEISNLPDSLQKTNTQSLHEKPMMTSNSPVDGLDDNDNKRFNKKFELNIPNGPQMHLLVDTETNDQRLLCNNRSKNGIDASKQVANALQWNSIECVPKGGRGAVPEELQQYADNKFKSTLNDLQQINQNNQQQANQTMVDQNSGQTSNQTPNQTQGGQQSNPTPNQNQIGQQPNPTQSYQSPTPFANLGKTPELKRKDS